MSEQPVSNSRATAPKPRAIDGEPVPQRGSPSPSSRFGEWLPIETAPKDGRWILCWSVTKTEEPRYPQRVRLWFWDAHRCRSRTTTFNPGGRGAWSYDDKILHQSGEEYEPTHWMPLPEPPAPILDLTATARAAQFLELANPSNQGEG